MGWTVTYGRPPGLSTREFFEQELPNTLGGKIVASGSANDGYESAFYAAVRDDDGEVWAFVALTSRGGGGYGYKEMEESMGPCAVHAPARVLRALTPTDNEAANDWREACWKNIAAEPPVKAGARVRFETPIEFANGAKHDVLTLQDAKRARFRSDDGLAYRLPRSWRRMYPYTVEGT